MKGKKERKKEWLALEAPGGTSAEKPGPEHDLEIGRGHWEAKIRVQGG